MAETIFQLKNLTFSYTKSDNLLFQDFSLSLNKGQTLAVIGRSGCGKSTLLKLIFGILRPDQGEISLPAKQIVYLGQEEAIIPWHTVQRNLMLPFYLKGQPISEENIQEAQQILENVGLLSWAKYPAATLSGGMRQRLELARALLQKPDLLLMDEPFASLDVFTCKQMIILCKTLQQQRGFALVFVTHQPQEAALLADQVLVLAGQPLQIITQSQFSGNAHPNLTVNPFSLPKEDQNVLGLIYESLSNENPKKPEEKPSGKSVFWPSDIFRFISSTGIAILFLIIVSWVKYIFQWPDYLLPYPIEIITLFFSTMRSGSIFPDLLGTTGVSVLSFALAWTLSIPCGYIMAVSNQAQRLLLPPLTILNTLPIIALAPFFLLWFGLGIMTKILITVLIIFFPLLLSSRQAFSDARTQTQIHRSNWHGTKGRSFIYLEWPYALPALFTAWRVALNGSIVGTVVSEFILGSVGLGARINLAKAGFDTTMMFVALIWLAILGLFYHFLIYSLEKLSIKKQES